MSTFKFGDIKIEVHRMGPDPLRKSTDFYTVKISQGDSWMESVGEKPRENRTAGSDFVMAIETLYNLHSIAANPEVWAAEMQSIGKMSQEEIDATVNVAENLQPYLDEAVSSSRDRLDLYSEHYESGVGPYDPSMGVARVLELPEKIRTKEDMARFFAYLYLVDRTSFHPDDQFSSYVYSKGSAAYTRKEAAIRQRLMKQAWQVSHKNGLDIYEVALWVAALIGAGDPENKESAPVWLKSLSNVWV